MLSLGVQVRSVAPPGPRPASLLASSPSQPLPVLPVSSAPLQAATSPRPSLGLGLPACLVPGSLFLPSPLPHAAASALGLPASAACPALRPSLESFPLGPPPLLFSPRQALPPRQGRVPRPFHSWLEQRGEGVAPEPEQEAVCHFRKGWKPPERVAGGGLPCRWTDRSGMPV